MFACLQNASTLDLQTANAYTSYGGKFAQWTFIPVTDGDLIRESPEKQLPTGKANGERILAGVRSSLSQLVAWVRNNQD